MRQVVIENPILNSAFTEPSHHFKFDDDGITDEVVEARRISSYFMPIPAAKKKGKQLELATEWTRDRVEENRFINRVRERVARWRQGGHLGVTPVTRSLLNYWTSADRDRPLFFCQIEALETAIYVTEVAANYGDTWIENELRRFNEDANPGLFRFSFKMATGSGKTVVMAMLIAWQALNKLANPQSRKFSDTFLVVTPGITIRDRLRVLLPNDPANYYIERDLVTAEQLVQLQKAKILITNFHAFLRRERGNAGKLTKTILKGNGPSAFTETPDEMVRRVCRPFGTKKNIIVLNDEAHHCYRRRVGGVEERLTGDERKEAAKRDTEARVWISGLEAVAKKLGVRGVYDLSATPFFLKGSGYNEGTLFPWVVSDFSLIDAIECGIVKVPRVPVADNAMVGELPTYRNLWIRIKDGLPKKGRGTQAVSGEPSLPGELEGAIQSLYSNYERYYRRWEQNVEAREQGRTPPVLIVVCNNTNVSKLVFDYISGWEKTLADGSKVVVPGKLATFSNEQDGRWRARPNTILVDSEQLESGEAMSPDFKKLAAVEIDRFKDEYRQRFPGRDADALTDEDLLREVMNTVGKKGRLGEHVKCVVSVSMLTEGWDANTVTHILGVRAFGTQLLCEQVVGRGLRRTTYAPNPEGRYEPEYAEVYGIPFSFIPCAGTAKDPKPGPMPTRVRALPERVVCEIRFPRLQGYRYDLPQERLNATFSKGSVLELSTAQLPTKTEIAPIVGVTDVHTLDDLKAKREQEVAFHVAAEALQRFSGTDDERKPWLFPQILAITRRWIRECVVLKDDTFIQLLLLIERKRAAADRIYRSVVASSEGDRILRARLRPYDPIGTTATVDFTTTRPVWPTQPDKCHVSHVVADTGSWEQKVAQTLEGMPEVLAYVKNHNLGFEIPYTMAGEEHRYLPDFIVRWNDGAEDPLSVIVEVTGRRRPEKAVKVATARELWVPAVNAEKTFGRWAFVEVTDPWNAATEIRSALGGRPSSSNLDLSEART